MSALKEHMNVIWMCLSVRTIMVLILVNVIMDTVNYRIRRPVHKKVLLYYCAYFIQKNNFY